MGARGKFCETAENGCRAPKGWRAVTLLSETTLTLGLMFSLVLPLARVDEIGEFGGEAFTGERLAGRFLACVTAKWRTKLTLKHY